MSNTAAQTEECRTSDLYCARVAEANRLLADNVLREAWSKLRESDRDLPAQLVAMGAMDRAQARTLRRAGSLLRTVELQARIAELLARFELPEATLQAALDEQARNGYGLGLEELLVVRGWFADSRRMRVLEELRELKARFHPSLPRVALREGRQKAVEPGALIAGRYRIEQPIGQGAMGSVFRARHVVTESPVALKLVGTEGEGAKARFLHEARSLGRLRHPNIVAVHDAGEARPGTLYLTLDYIEGETLSDRIARTGPLPLPLLLDCLRQILAAADHAHDLGVVHRDLKADNLMLEQTSRGLSVKILDFGVARLMECDQQTGGTPREGEIFGTPAYMSPEQAAGGEATPLSDLYSIGVIAYEMATGRLPFLSTTSVGFLGQHMAEQPDPPGRYREALPDWLDAFVLRLLEKEPTKRFASARAALEALGR